MHPGPDGGAPRLHTQGIWGLGPRARAGPRLPHVWGGWGLGASPAGGEDSEGRGWGLGPGEHRGGRAQTRPERSPPRHSPARLSPAPARRTRGVGAARSGIGRTWSSEPSRVWGWGPRCPNSQEWCLGVDETHMWAQRLAQHMVPELRSSCHQGPEEAGWAGGRRSLLPVILTQRPRVPVCALAKLPFQGSETEGCVRITRGRRGGRPTDWGLPPRRPPALPADQAWPCPASQ